MNISAIIFLCLWFLLPIAPAFILFKVLPGTAVANGPFKGLKINLSGAFAGYFLLFLASWPVMNMLLKAKPDKYEVWLVKGTVVDPATGKAIPDTKNPRITINPPVRIVNGAFKFRIIAEKQGDDTYTFPIVSIAADGYVTSNLESLDINANETPQKKHCSMNGADKQAIYTRFELPVDSTLIPHTESIAYVAEDK
ncbi:MAG: hypothetical protein ABI480_02825 [Chitinophagaceae bacterium]